MRHWKLYAIAAFLTFSPLVAFAAADAVAAPVWSDIAVEAIKGLTAPLIVVIVWAVRKYVVPKVPRAAIPVAVMLLGYGADFLVSMATGTTMSPLGGVLIGSAAIALREIVTTLQEHGINA